MKDWLRHRRQQLKLTQEQVTARMGVNGWTLTSGAYSHWERGLNEIDFNNPLLINALARALEWDIEDLLYAAGIMSPRTMSQLAQRAARIIDRMPANKQELALDFLEKMLNS